MTDCMMFGKTLMGKSEPDNASTITAVTKKLELHPISGAQKGIELKRNRIRKYIRIAKTMVAKNARIMSKFVWKKNGGFKIIKSIRNSKAAKDKFRILLAISLINQYLK